MDPETGCNFSKTMTSEYSKPKGPAFTQQLIQILIPTLGIYILMSLLDGWIAMPMRVGSTWIALGLLKIPGLPFELQGATLVAPDFVFEVIPACSGSTTLRILVFLSALYIWTRPQWPRARKLVGVLMAVPVALAANALRLVLLAGIGYVRGEPLEGLAHEWTGLMAFSIGFVTLLVISETLKPRPSGSANNPSKIDIKKTKGHPWALAGILFLIGALYTNLWVWLYLGWRDSPLDRLGWIYTGVGGVLLIGFLFWCETKMVRSYWSKTTIALHLSAVVSFLALSFICQIAGVNILFGVTCCLALVVAVQGRYGWAALHAAIPLIGALFIGFPTLPYILNQILSKLLSVNSSVGIGKMLQASGGIIMLTVSFIGFQKTKRQMTGLKSPATASDAMSSISLKGTIWSRLVVLWLLLALAIKIGYSDFGKSAFIPSQLRISYQLGDWKGLNQEPSNIVIGWELGRNFWSRVYLKDLTDIKNAETQSEQKSIGLLIASSNGNRHNMHPPEYCFTGSGWKITDTELKEVEFQHAGRQPVTALQVEREGKKLFGYYWYTDGKEYLADYKSILLEDIRRRAIGEKSNWFFFRVLTGDLETLEKEFWPQFEGELESGDETFRF